MKVKIKKLHPDAVIPAYAKAGDAGMDLTAVSVTCDVFGNICYGTGLAFEIPEGYVGLVFPRSSNHKKGVILTNCVGVIDSGYRGEVSFKFRPLFEIAGSIAGDGFKEEHKKNKSNFDENQEFYFLKYPGNHSTFKVGDRIGQIIIMPYPQIEFEEVQELSETERGTKGYGSSGS